MGIILAWLALGFRAQEIQRDFGVVYAVLAADMNQDHKPDIVAINPTQAVWYENPTWEKHVVVDGATKKDNVCIAAHDIDGDGWTDLAVGADWQPSNTQSGGSLQWIGRDGANPARLWETDADRGGADAAPDPLGGRGPEAGTGRRAATREGESRAGVAGERGADTDFPRAPRPAARSLAGGGGRRFSAYCS
jgi:hypothetical protein